MSSDKLPNYMWHPPPVEVEPRTLLSQWRVYQVDMDFDGAGMSNHLIGVTRGGSGRVSSPVQEFDHATQCAVTRSGRIYELVGPSGTSSNATFVWTYWLVRNNILEYTEITQDYEPENTGS